MNIQFAATLDGASRKKDKSISLRAISNFEMSTEDFSQIDRLLGSTGWILFSPNELQESDIPEEPAPTREGKSKGQRLRAIYFLLWRKLNVDEAFDPWYDRVYETYLDKLKSRLD